MKEYPWVKHYEAGVPHALQPYPDITVLDVLADTLKQRPEHPLAIFQAREVSHLEVEEHSNALAAASATKEISSCAIFPNYLLLQIICLTQEKVLVN
jgi:long-chain acyl-CoA synthetase